MPLPAVRLEELDEPLMVGGHTHRVRGWIGLREDPQGTKGTADGNGGGGAGTDPVDRPAASGLRCYSLGRLVVAGEYCGHPDATHRLALGRLTGEVHLDFVPLVMNKTGGAT